MPVREFLQPAGKGRAIGDRFVDLHPRRRIVAPGQEPARDTGGGFDGGEERADRVARVRIVGRDAIVDADVGRRRRWHQAEAGRSVTRGRGAAAAGTS